MRLSCMHSRGGHLVSTFDALQTSGFMYRITDNNVTCRSLFNFIFSIQVTDKNHYGNRECWRREGPSDLRTEGSRETDSTNAEIWNQPRKVEMSKIDDPMKCRVTNTTIGSIDRFVLKQFGVVFIQKKIVHVHSLCDKMPVLDHGWIIPRLAIRWRYLSLHICIVSSDI